MWGFISIACLIAGAIRGNAAIIVASAIFAVAQEVSMRLPKKD